MFQTMALGTRRSARGPAISLTMHGAVVALLFLAGAAPAVRRTLAPAVDHFSVIVPFLAGHGGGGGGDRSPIPASRGALPKFAPHQFTPPSAVIHNLEPKLPMEPTLIISPDVRVSQVNLAVLGDPFGQAGPPSNGSGSGGGMGTGDGTGIGPGTGPGLGPGRGGNTGGGPGGYAVYEPPETPPVLIFKVEPEFSDEARKAKLQGVVTLYAEVDTSGHLRNIRVTQRLGLGLDEKAIEAVRQWRFRPAYRGGHPVVAAAAIEVNFRLL